jgi:hypothetical protein
VEYLTFENSDIYNKLPKNSIRIKFTSTLAPVFLYCALVCFNKNFPEDSVLLNGPNYDNLSPFIKYDSIIIPVSFGTFSFSFNNLIRGMAYKLKCILRNTNSSTSKSYKVTLSKIKKYRKRIFLNDNIFYDNKFTYEENSNGYYKLYDEADIFPTSNLIEFQKFYAEIKYLTIFPRIV